MTAAPRLLLPAALLGLLLALPRAAESTSVKRLTHEELVRDAERIVHADCTDSSPEWDPSRTRVFTRVRFRVREGFKGGEDSGLELLIPGGSLGGIVHVVHGMPTFQPGEEVVLYATAAHPKSGVRVPVGLDQGCYRIQREREGGRARARRDMRELLLVEPGKRAVQGERETVTLDELTAKVRGEVTRQRKQREDEERRRKERGK
ncbi:MAG: hypothetical protein AB7N76_08555 [Planctomycetota bacterium]